MKLRAITAADWRLDECGRFVPPVGFQYVDLARIIPLIGSIEDTAGEGVISTAPSKTVRLVNQSPTVFLAYGFAVLDASILFNVRWPGGYLLNAAPIEFGGFPFGRAGAQWGFQHPIALGPGEYASLDLKAQTGGGSISVQVWGVLRYLVAPDSVDSAVPGGCLVGYPAGVTKTGVGSSAWSESSPVASVESIENEPRYKCAAVGQNLVALQSDLGNQGYDGSPVSWSSDPVSLAQNEAQFDLSVQVPFDGMIDLMSVRAVCEWVDYDGGLADLAYNVRTADNWQLSTEMVKNSAVGHWPVFPSKPVRGGDFMTIDLQSSIVVEAPSEDARLVVRLEFFGVKRGAE